MEQVVNEKIKEESNMQDEPPTKDLFLLFGEKKERKKDMLPNISQVELTLSLQLSQFKENGSPSSKMFSKKL